MRQAELRAAAMTKNVMLAGPSVSAPQSVNCKTRPFNFTDPLSSASAVKT